MVVTRNSRIRVLLVGPVPPPYGGIPTYVKQLYEARIKGVDFSLFNTALPDWVAPLTREGKRHYQFMSENGFFTGLKILLYVLGSYPVFLLKIFMIRPQIVQVFTCSFWGYWRNWVYLLLAKLCQRKTIFHLLNAIDIFYSEVGKIQKKWLERSLNSADTYLLQSPGLQRWVEKFSRRKVLGIWNGIDFDSIPIKGELPKFIAGLKMPIGITVGSLGKNKGTYDILENLERMHSAGVKIGWIFVGGGNLREFRDLAESKGLSNCVLFTGAIDEPLKWQYLHHADFFCLPSYAEGQPISILEAMAVGLPVISTDIGSIPEILNDGISARVIRTGDKRALEQAIRQIALDPDLRRRIAKEAFSVVKNRHDSKSLFPKLGKIYRALVSYNENPDIEGHSVKIGEMVSMLK